MYRPYLAALAALSLLPSTIAYAASQKCSSVAINNQGEIETHGQNSPHIRVSKNGVEVTNSQRIVTNDDNCAGLSAKGRGNVTVNNTGSITTTGEPPKDRLSKSLNRQNAARCG